MGLQNLINYNPVKTTTTPRPRPRPTQRPSRPILDGLSWLWRTWQETGTRASPATPRPTTPPSYQFDELSLDDDGFDSDGPSAYVLILIENFVYIQKIN